MKLPDGDRAVVEPVKVGQYLLSDSHPIGRFKARFLRALGFRASEPEVLVRELLRLARDGEVSGTEDNPYGRKYLVGGALQGPAGSSAVVTVWFVNKAGGAPRLVTVRPRK